VKIFCNIFIGQYFKSGDGMFRLIIYIYQTKKGSYIDYINRLGFFFSLIQSKNKKKKKKQDEANHKK